MHLVDSLPLERLRVPLVATTKTAVIEELLGLLPFEDPAVRRAVRQSVLDREAEASTGIGRGVGVPHGRTEAVGEHVCALGIAPAGIEFDAIDGKACRLFFVCVSNPDRADEHLVLLSELAGLLNDTERHRALEDARTPEEAREIIVSAFATATSSDPPG